MTEPFVVDARGQRCPMPVITLARRARDLPAGSVLVVLATDPAARLDIPAWARLRGHETLAVEEVAGSDHWRLTVRLGPRPA